MSSQKESKNPTVEEIYARISKIEDIEDNEPFVQGLKDLKEIAEQKGQRKGNIHVIGTENRQFDVSTGYPEKYSTVTEWVMDNSTRAASNRPLLRLRYFNNAEVSVIIDRDNFPKWNEFEAPSESEIEPSMESRLEPWDDINGHLWLNGPLDSLGPNSLAMLRTLTQRAIKSFGLQEQLPDY